MIDYEQIARYELAVSRFNKLTAEGLVTEIERIAGELRGLLPLTKDNWPEFIKLTAELRGYNFNAFNIIRPYREQQLHQPQRAKAETIDLDELLKLL